MRKKQEEPYARLLDAPQDVYVVLGTGRGKTVMALKRVADSGWPALVFVDNGALMEQWIERACGEELFGLEAQDVGRCRGPVDQWEWKGRSLCIATFQSFLPKYERGEVPEEFFSYFGWVVFDEAHVLVTPLRKKLLSLFLCRRMCLTATPERRQWENVVFQHTGRPVIEDREPDLLPRVFVRSVSPTRKKEYPLRSLLSYSSMENSVLGTKKRKGDPAYFTYLVSLLEELRARGRKTMVLASRTTFLRKIRDHVKDVAVIEGKVDFSDRTWMLRSSDIVAVTTSIGEKALDRADLDTLVMTIPVGSAAKTRMRQGAGRILRALADKERPELYILYPESAYGKKLGAANASMCAMFGYAVEERPEFDEEKERAKRMLTDLRSTKSTGFRMNRRQG